MRVARYPVKDLKPGLGTERNGISSPLTLFPLHFSPFYIFLGLAAFKVLRLPKIVSVFQASSCCSFHPPPAAHGSASFLLWLFVAYPAWLFRSIYDRSAALRAPDPRSHVLRGELCSHSWWVEISGLFARVIFYLPEAIDVPRP